jgi:PadR family transcriptional regulator PadR
MGSSDVALSQSTLNYLVLKALAMGADHGFGVARWVERITDDALSVEEGSLYPALHRLERQGLLESRWGRTEHNRRAKFYRLTAEGQGRLDSEQENWHAFADAMAKVAATGSDGG